MAPANFYRCASLLAVLAAAVSLGIGRGGQRGAARQVTFNGIRVKKPPVFKPLTMAEESSILTQNGVLKVPSSVLRAYDMQHGYDQFGGLYFLDALEVSFGENFVELNSGSNAGVLAFFQPIAVRKKHMVIVSIRAQGAGTISIQAGGEDNSWNGPVQTVPVVYGPVNLSMVIQPKSRAPVKVVVWGNRTAFFFYKVTAQLVK